MTTPVVGGWEVASLDSVGRLHCGQSPAAAEVNATGVGVPYVSGPDHWDGNKLAITKWTTSPRRIVPDGCVFVTVKGAGVGKVFPGVSCAIGRDIYAFEPAGGVSSPFIEHRLRFEIAEIIRKASGDIPGLSKVDILGHKVLVPPVAEQHRIVAAIEEQLSRVEAGVLALERVKNELARYRASVLKAACEGRLVPTEAALARAEGRCYEAASDVLARILAERLARWDGKIGYADPTAPDSGSLPPLPEGWVWASLDQVLLSLRNGVSAVPRETSGVAILRISAVRALRVDLTDRRFLAGPAASYEGYVLEAGDVLFTRYNGSRDLVGVCACLPTPNGPLIYPDKIIRVRVQRELVAQFIAMAANVNASRAHIEKRIRTTAGQSGISGGDLRSMPVPLPPVAEQQRIVAEVERRLSIADEIAATVDSALARAARLRQSILKRAFEGKLVPQDPNDEPASVLLARILAEREAANPQSKPSKRTRRASGSAETPPGVGRRRKETPP